VVDVRIMAATNRDLAAEVAAGRFRADLFYRLRVIPITLPPLRERREDILPLVKHFVAHFNREFGKHVREIAPEAEALLGAYRWSGNVRELRNVIERAVLLADGETIGARELPLEVTAPMAAPVAAPLPDAGVKLDEMERRLLVQALERTGGNQSHAAQLLGLSRHQVRTRMKRHGLLMALLAAMALLPGGARAQDAQRSARCEQCHADREVLARLAPHGFNPDSLYVNRAILSRSVHAGVPCLRCHPIPGLMPHPGEARTTVPCGTCHAPADSLWRAGPHGGRRGLPEAPCQGCHGTHDVRPGKELERGEGARSLSRRCVVCHKDRQFQPGDVHKDRVSCATCHGAHMIQPVRDPATHGIALGIAQRCAACHDSVAANAFTDTHGVTARAQAASRVPLTGDTAATCISCHGGHGMKPAHDLDREVALVERCAACHRHEGETYADTYHGRATRVGYYRAARCTDCHGSHQIFPSSDARSPTSPGRLVATCAQCHGTAARASFVSYRAHVHPTDIKDNPAVFGAWLLMNVLLFSVFAVFGVHTVLWLARLLEIRWRERQRRRELGLEDEPLAKKPIDSAARGKGPFVWRFKLFHRWIHGISVVSFFALIITGLPLRFSCAVWAADMMRLLGGTRAAGIVHRTAGAITVAYFTVHLIYLAVFVARSKNRKALFWGPDSMVPQPQDVRDFVQMFKWFIARAPYPGFGRYAYSEKFHYLGAFWGIVLLGGSGMVRWLPGIFTHVLPGWAFNVAAIFHSEEALLAAGFMFIIHFFNVHLRPGKFPLDGVMFTGRATAQVLEEEHALTTEAWGDLASKPVSRKAIPDLPAPPPPHWMTVAAASLGLIALAVGLVLIGMIMWVQMC
jgi:cytochrome b subunit of formate dehydrogenase